MGFSKVNIEERFWSRVDKSDECWLWTGHKNYNGYGSIYFEGKPWQAHRLSYTLTKGEIPKGLFCCHKCDNPSCVNPEHLWLGTPNDNVQDMVAKGRQKKSKKEGYVPHKKKPIILK